MSALGYKGLIAAYLVLLAASAGVLHHSGIKIPYFAFFGHDAAQGEGSTLWYAGGDGWRQCALHRHWQLPPFSIRSRHTASTIILTMPAMCWDRWNC